MAAIGGDSRELQQVVWKEKELAFGVAVLFLFGVLAGFLLLKVMSMLVKGMELAVDEDYLQQLLAQKPDFDLYLYTTWKKLKGILLFLMLRVFPDKYFAKISCQGNFAGVQLLFSASFISNSALDLLFFNCI